MDAAGPLGSDMTPSLTGAAGLEITMRRLQVNDSVTRHLEWRTYPAAVGHSRMRPAPIG